MRSSTPNVCRMKGCKLAPPLDVEEVPTAAPVFVRIERPVRHVRAAGPAECPCCGRPSMRAGRRCGDCAIACQPDGEGGFVVAGMCPLLRTAAPATEPEDTAPPVEAAHEEPSMTPANPIYDRMLDMMRASPEKDFTRAELLAFCESAATRDAAGMKLGKLVTAGQIERTGLARYRIASEAPASTPKKKARAKKPAAPMAPVKPPRAEREAFAAQRESAEEERAELAKEAGDRLVEELREAGGGDVGEGIRQFNARNVPPVEGDLSDDEMAAAIENLRSGDVDPRDRSVPELRRWLSFVRDVISGATPTPAEQGASRSAVALRAIDYALGLVDAPEPAERAA